MMWHWLDTQTSFSRLRRLAGLSNGGRAVIIKCYLGPCEANTVGVQNVHAIVRASTHFQLMDSFGRFCHHPRLKYNELNPEKRKK
jgi:hypothetical protein